MKIMVGNDHGGFLLKRDILRYLSQNKNIEITDIGTDSEEVARYPYYAAKVAGAVSRGRTDRGILICSTGIGVSILANRFKGIRATLCTSTYMAKMCRAHNDSNILCLGGKLTGPLEALDILETWLSGVYEGGRHSISLELIKDLDSGFLTDELIEKGCRERQ
jgi:ribose 5-phosphate isomerase B